MLTHPRSRRQERRPTITQRLPAEASLASPPEVLDTDLDEPTALELLPHIHAAGHGGGDVDARGVPHFPSELVLCPCCSCRRRRPGPRACSAGGLSTCSCPCGPASSYLGCSRARYPYRRPRPLAPSSDVGDPDPRPAAELDLPVREGHLVPGEALVVGQPHPARIAPRRGPVRGLAGGLVLRALRPPLLVYPRAKIVGLSFRQKPSTSDLVFATACFTFSSKSEAAILFSISVSEAPSLASTI